MHPLLTSLLSTALPLSHLLSLSLSLSLSDSHPLSVSPISPRSPTILAAIILQDLDLLHTRRQLRLPEPSSSDAPTTPQIAATNTT